MRVILYLAISADGLIAKKDGDSDWVSEVDAEEFERKIKVAGCVTVGRKTYKQYLNDIFPVKEVYNFILTKSSENQRKESNVLFVKSPQEIIKLAEEKGCKYVLVIGGGETNASFLKENLIDEIFLSVHPLILGSGIHLFQDIETFTKLELLAYKKLKEGLVQLHYKVIK